jgi:hypothetical protein
LKRLFCLLLGTRFGKYILNAWCRFSRDFSSLLNSHVACPERGSDDEPHSAADDSPIPSEADHGPGPDGHARKEHRLDQHIAASGEQITGWLACGFRQPSAAP